eukprot:8868219-Ditylum_brightwellii.AAC.1
MEPALVGMLVVVVVVVSSEVSTATAIHFLEQMGLEEGLYYLSVQEFVAGSTYSCRLAKSIRTSAYKSTAFA